MRTVFLVLTLSVASAPAHAATMQAGATEAEICIVIDEARDTLSPQERAGAIRLLANHFELAGRQVVVGGCAIQYTLSHIRLGENVFVTLSGSEQRREGIAVGLDDLSALYSQMVRSIITGRPMIGFNVLDRTNVTIAQASANRVYSDRFGYVRLGYGALFGDRTYRTPSVGFGYRFELDSFGLDISFLNLQTGESSYESPGGATTSSWLKLQGLYFLKPTANASAYLGGGLSWGSADFDDSSGAYRGATYSTNWHGGGLQGELTVGYELPRASTLRVFVEANSVLPIYKVSSETYAYSTSGGTTTVERRYAPSVVVSMGVGWQRNRGRR